MKHEIGLRIELEVPAQRLLSSLKFYNEGVEKQIEEGVNLAIKELSENKNISRMVADAVKKKLDDNIIQYVMSYEVNNAIRSAITGAITTKINEYSEELSKKIYDQLKPTAT